MIARFCKYRDSGWTVDEIRFGMRKVYNVDMVRVARFLNSREGIDFLSLHTSSYYPRNGPRNSGIPALRSAIIKASLGGKLSSVGIIGNLPVDIPRLAKKRQMAVRRLIVLLNRLINARLLPW